MMRRVATGRLPDDEFRRLVDEAKSRHNLSDIIGRHTKLTRRGSREVVGLCPFHLEKSPSFEVNDAKGTYHCWGCKEVGDAMTFLQKVEGMTFREAFETLSGDTFPTVSEQDRVRRKQEAEQDTARRIRTGRAVWDRAVPAAGTLAETYARSRRIVAPLPDTVRFARLDYWDQSTNTVIARDVPAMVCALQDGGGSVVGVQRIYLAADGAGKMPGVKAKLSLGIIVGSAFRASGSDEPGEAVVLCEGPEDGLTLAQELAGACVLAACGTALMPRLELPASVQTVTLAGDNNAPGRAAVEAGAEAYRTRGLTVRAMFPAAGFKDWNDELRGVRA
jgi:DNA primase